MKEFLTEWRKIEKEIQNKPVYLFLDFDGTLAGIRKHPEKVRLSKETKEILERLVACKDVFLSIVTGRKLVEIQQLVNIKGITYVGNHGFEATGPGLRYTYSKALTSREIIKKLHGRLKEALKLYKNVIVEDKKFTVSVHFRMASKSEARKTEEIFKNITALFVKKGRIRVTGGRKIWEIRPPEVWDKGTIALFLIKRKRQEIKKKIIPIYFGDEETDEDAFRRLKKRGYTIKVGNSPKGLTNAEYYLRNRRDVNHFLREFSKNRGEGGKDESSDFF